MSPYQYFIINKPANMISQFVSSDEVRLLGELNYDFPPGTNAVGRLDSHSEGLLILTNNRRVVNLLFQGEIPHKRTYCVNVGHIVSEKTLELLRTGITIRIKGGADYVTAPCEVEIIDRPGHLPIVKNEERADIPNTWLKITLTEGKYHQIRKMVRSAGHRCKRLVRTSIENLELGDLPPGGVREIEETEFFRLLRITNWKSAAAPCDVPGMPPV
ncbi:pseudouridine synthase [Dyadobacter sandarakinus]|uniref:Pseudouridine synthase n=1 Tax=Dyadobacter sandarakinus TaxID=2747268 RepID=A0ABX7ICM8_9BACT|nr:pseudouridine synthase [Dyadobacter sandarakinus]QRR03292.1 pseudouridine synthase [Dyadobacter sandarakinus]